MGKKWEGGEWSIFGRSSEIISGSVSTSIFHYLSTFALRFWPPLVQRGSVFPGALGSKRVGDERGMEGGHQNGLDRGKTPLYGFWSPFYLSGAL